MKLLASRGSDDPQKTQSDVSDIIGLMTITDIDTADALVGLMRECFPHLPGLQVGINPRLKAKIDPAMDRYVTGLQLPDSTWHAGRGAATRED